MPPRAFGVTVPADARYLKVVRAFFKPVLEEHFGEESGMIILALDESCSNIVKHQSKNLDDGMITARVQVTESLVRLRIGDFCGQEDVENIRPRDLQDVRPGGLGTHFVDQIMDHVAFEPEPGKPGRLALVLEKKIPEGKQEDGEPRNPR
ncbi:MAG: hypothetical protein CMJ83_21460 [Planctomycetes bacterium]|nr:hypothetical protein [Planctomycetota bacterium]